jgi:hypothetical protein
MWCKWNLHFFWIKIDFFSSFRKGGEVKEEKLISSKNEKPHKGQVSKTLLSSLA